MEPCTSQPKLKNFLYSNNKKNSYISSKGNPEKSFCISADGKPAKGFLISQEIETL